MTVAQHSRDTTRTIGPTEERAARPIDVAGEEPACPACPHPLAQHDPIGARFCRATADSAISRGCVCSIG
jgi:hypothetical protein